MGIKTGADWYTSPKCPAFRIRDRQSSGAIKKRLNYGQI